MRNATLQIPLQDSLPPGGGASALPENGSDADETPYSDAQSPGGRIARMIADYPVTQRYRKAGDYLFHARGDFHSIFVLMAGFAKTRRVAEDGREQVTGFHLRGDILGLEAISTGAFGCDAIALDTCSVVSIPYDVVLARSHGNSELMQALYTAFSAEIRSERDLQVNRGSLHAEGRVADFLLELSRRFAERGFSGTTLQLHLSRQEIGSLLGLKLETVSRALSHFAKLGLIDVYLRDIVLHNLDGLLDIVATPAVRERQRKATVMENFLCAGS